MTVRRARQEAATAARAAAQGYAVAINYKSDEKAAASVIASIVKAARA